MAAIALVAFAAVSLVFYIIGPLLFSILGPEARRSFGWLVGWSLAFSLICAVFAEVLFLLSRRKKP